MPIKSFQEEEEEAQVRKINYAILGNEPTHTITTNKMEQRQYAAASFTIGVFFLFVVAASRIFFMSVPSMRIAGDLNTNDTIINGTTINGTTINGTTINGTTIACPPDAFWKNDTVIALACDVLSKICVNASRIIENNTVEIIENRTHFFAHCINTEARENMDVMSLILFGGMAMVFFAFGLTYLMHSRKNNVAPLEEQLLVTADTPRYSTV